VSNNYIPDFWVVLKVPLGGLNFYKVLGAWSGGYIHGNSWRLSSGITKVVKDNNFYNFENVSGSCYMCHKDSYGLHFGSVSIYEKLVKEYGAETLGGSLNWEEINWDV
jgi:hypothetical protein